MSLQALREKRKKLALDARALVENNTGDAWTGELNQQYENMLSEIERVDAEVDRLERTQNLVDARTEQVSQIADSQGIGLQTVEDNLQREHEIFDTYLRGGLSALTPEQQTFAAQRAAGVQNAQSTGTASEGGYLVPTDFAATLLEEMKAFGGVRNVANVVSTAMGNTIQWPTTNATAEEGEQLDENTKTNEADTSFDSVSIGAYMFSSKTVRVPFQLIQDSSVDIVAYIRRLLAQRLARITNKKFTIGTGVGTINGVVTASSLGKAAVAGQVDGVTFADLVDLEHSVDPAYREAGNMRFMFHDDTLKALKKMEDGDGRPLFLPGVDGRAHNTILGYEYQINQNMPVMAAGAKSILFGDFSKYMIRDVMDVMLFRMQDSEFTTRAQTGFVAFSRHDGDLIDSSDSAIKHFQNAAA